MYNKPLVPDNFVIPKSLETDEFLLAPLTVNHLIKDYDAVMSSVSHLTGLMGDDDWPSGLTLEENLADLGWHQTEFTFRTSFAYSVLTLDEQLCLGCCYIYPSVNSQYEVDAYYWIRADYLASGLETRLGDSFKSWLEADWPFLRINFPSRKHGLVGANLSIIR